MNTLYHFKHLVAFEINIYLSICQMAISIKPICDWSIYLTASAWLALHRLPFTPLHRL